MTCVAAHFEGPLCFYAHCLLHTNELPEARIYPSRVLAITSPKAMFPRLSPFPRRRRRATPYGHTLRLAPTCVGSLGFHTERTDAGSGDAIFGSFAELTFNPAAVRTNGTVVATECRS